MLFGLPPPTAIVGEVGRPVSGGRLSAFFAGEDEDGDETKLPYLSGSSEVDLNSVACKADVHAEWQQKLNNKFFVEAIC